jgi:hypothetical protein
MKKNIYNKMLVLTIVILFIFLSAIPSVNSNANNKPNTKNNSEFEIYSKTLEFSSPQIKDNKDSVSIIIDEAPYYTQSTGKPMLPYTSFVLTFPLGTNIENIDISYSNPKKICLNKPVKIAPSLNWYNTKNIPDDKIITLTNSISKTPWISYQLGGGIDKGEHVTFLSFHVYPVCYDSKNLFVEFINKIDINFIYKTSQSLFLEDKYSFVIISPSNFMSPLEKLANHKSENGLTTKLVSLDHIYNGEFFPAEGYDEPEKIKYFIKNAVEQWGTEYILLIGSIYNLPMRTALFDDMELLTDLYYADLYFEDGSFCDWDSNGNHIYGEYWYNDEKDNVDLYSDVYLGRIPCMNILDVYIAVNKIIKYESKPLMPHDKWWDKIILLGGDTFPGWGVYEGEVTNQCIAEALPEFNHVKLWTSEGTFTPKNINEEVNKGARFLEYSGHGYEFGMGTSPPNEQNRIQYYTRNLLNLHNSHKLPVVFFDACLTAKLDYVLGDLLKLYGFLNIPLPVYAWYWVKKIGGGAIATIGATEVAFSYVDANGPIGGAGYLSLHFFEGYHSCKTVSEMLVYSQNDYLNNLWKDHWTIEQFTLLGDPTLKVGGISE